MASCTGIVESDKSNAGISGTLTPQGNGGSGTVGTVGGGNVGNTGNTGSGQSTAGTGSDPGTGVGSGAGSGPVCADQPMPTRAPMRRLTRFEYNNTLVDLKLDTTDLAVDLPSEDLGNGFGNDTDTQSVASELAKKYQSIAETIGSRLTATGTIGTTLPCAVGVTAANEVSCAKTFIQDFGPKVFRRPLDAGESDSFVSLFSTVRAKSDFPSSIGAIIEAALQDPAFLYRPEFGVPVAGRTDLLRPTGAEMATRLSYLFWGTTPDDALRSAAAAGSLDTPEGVQAKATTMLADARTKSQVRFFFDNLLPIASLNQLTRDAMEYPAYTSKLGLAMREETQTFLEHTIFDGSGGTWPSVFTADYTYVNQDLATFYGISGVTGTDFKKVQVDTNKRLGLLTQAGMVAGTIHSNETNPVVRGGFIVRKLLCQDIQLPTGAVGAMVVVPAADASKTARQRYTAHSSNAVCHACHTNMDPVGFAFENYDPIGQWRDQENGVTIDPSGTAPALGDFKGPADLAKQMAASPAANQCFAANWINYGYARTITATGTDACTVNSIQQKFKDAGYNVQKLLLSLTQSDAFLYLPAARE